MKRKSLPPEWQEFLGRVETEGYSRRGWLEAAFRIYDKVPEELILALADYEKYCNSRGVPCVTPNIFGEEQHECQT